MSINLKAITSCMGYQQITVLTTPQSLTVPTTNREGLNAKPTLALFIVEGQAVRWRDDGIAPTPSVGMPTGAGMSFSYDGDLKNIKFVEQAPGAILNISYYA